MAGSRHGYRHSERSEESPLFLPGGHGFLASFGMTNVTNLSVDELP